MEIINPIIELWTDITTKFKEKGIPYKFEPVYCFKSSDERYIKPHDDHDGELLKYLISGPCVRGADVPKGSITLPIDASLKYIEIDVNSADLFPNLELYKRFKDMEQPRNELRLMIYGNRLEVDLFLFDTHIEQNDLDTIKTYFSEYTKNVTLTEIPKAKSYRKCDH